MSKIIKITMLALSLGLTTILSSCSGFHPPKLENGVIVYKYEDGSNFYIGDYSDNFCLVVEGIDIKTGDTMKKIFTVSKDFYKNLNIGDSVIIMEDQPQEKRVKLLHPL